MKKILSVLTCSAFLFASTSLFSPQLEAASNAPDYEWGTFEVIAGIATCDGAADNCTKPVRQESQSIEGDQMT